MTINVKPVTTFTKRVDTPKADAIAIYIGFESKELCLFEVDVNNQPFRKFYLDPNDSTIPSSALEEAVSAQNTPLSMVKVYSHPDYIENYKVTSNLKYKKQHFWLRRTADLRLAS